MDVLEEADDKNIEHNEEYLNEASENLLRENDDNETLKLQELLQSPDKSTNGSVAIDDLNVVIIPHMSEIEDSEEMQVIKSTDLKEILQSQNLEYTISYMPEDFNSKEDIFVNDTELVSSKQNSIKEFECEEKISIQKQQWQAVYSVGKAVNGEETEDEQASSKETTNKDKLDNDYKVDESD